MITSRVIIDNFNKLTTTLLDKDVIKNLEDIGLEQEKNKSILLSNCDTYILLQLDKSNSSRNVTFNDVKEIQGKKIYEIYKIEKEFYNSDTLFYYTRPMKTFFEYLDRVKTYTKYSEYYSLLAVKKSNNEMIHEMLVGLYVTNSLKKYIPNFAYLYAGIANTNEIIYENVFNNITLRQYIKKCSASQFLNIYMQLVYALKWAYIQFDYTHYDLHNDNVIVKTTEPKQILYYTENGKEYLQTESIATIIDFSSSHFKLSERHFGKGGYEKYSIYSYKSNIFHDLYKILMFSLLESYNTKNTAVFNEAVKIFRYFNTYEDAKSALSTQYEYLFSLPLDENTKQFDIDNFAKYIRQNCNCNFISKNKFDCPLYESGFKEYDIKFSEKDLSNIIMVDLSTYKKEFILNEYTVTLLKNMYTYMLEVKDSENLKFLIEIVKKNKEILDKIPNDIEWYNKNRKLFEIHFL